MTTRVLVVNHGVDDVMVETYRKRNVVLGVFAPDPVVKRELVRAHQELSCLVHEREYISVVEAKK